MTPRTKLGSKPEFAPAQPDGRGDHTNLSHHYGSIGIQAVAAAARYSDRPQEPGACVGPGTADRSALRGVRKLSRDHRSDRFRD